MVQLVGNVRLFVLCLLVGVGLTSQAEVCENVELTQSETTVMDAYIAYYGRPADAGGLSYWSNRLTEDGGDLRSIIAAFGTSAEYESRFNGMSNQQLVSNIYRQLFNREPDAGGLDFYTGELDAGRRSLQSITLDVLYGAQNEDIEVLANKRTVAQDYFARTRESEEGLSSTALAELLADVSAGPDAADLACNRSASLLGEQSTWQAAGFGAAGNFLNVYFDPASSGVVYATSDVAGVYRSSDGGRSWQIRSAGLGNSQVASLALDPFDANTLYAGVGALATSARAGIYVSTNAGMSWSQLPATNTVGITFRRFRTVAAIAPDPAQPGVILSGSRSVGIWRSTDAGETWVQVYAPPMTNVVGPFPEGLIEDDPQQSPHPAPVSVVVFDPNDSSVVYAGFIGGGIIKSTASGVEGSWQQINQGLPADATIEHLAVGPNDVLYAAAGFDGIYKSSDEGSSWQAANGDTPLVDDEGEGWRTGVAVHPGDPDIAYMSVATYGAFPVFRTADGGGSWEQVQPASISHDVVNDPTRVWSAGTAMGWQVKIDPFDTNHLLATDFWSIQRSEDAGSSWSDSIIGAQNTCVNDLLVDGDTIYAALWDSGLLKSVNDGENWTAVLPTSDADDHLLGGHFWRIAKAQVGVQTYYFTTSDPWNASYGQVLRSTDAIHWTSVFQSPRAGGDYLDGMLGLAIDPITPSTIYVSQDGGSISRSVDNGATWAATTGQPGDSSFSSALVVTESGHVFAGTVSGGLWRSRNGGGSWQQVLTEQGSIFNLQVSGGAILASTGDGNLYRSENDGEDWQRLTDFNPTEDGDGVSDQGSAIAVDPGDSNHLYFSLQDTWHSSDTSLGVYESTDGGESWAALNDGLGLLNVGVLTVSEDGDLFAGTSCAGIWRLSARN